MERNKRRPSLGISDITKTKPQSLKIADSEGELSGVSRLPELPVIQVGKENRLERWAIRHRDEIESILTQEGGVLFRGFSVSGYKGFQQFCQGYMGELLPYRERSTPRTEVGDRVYTSTEYPRDQYIALHNEYSYAVQCPMRICFYALQPPIQGGETPLADGRKVYEHIDAPIRSKFVDKGVMYIRRYGWDIDLTWQEVYRTKHKAEVEEYCRENSIDWEWSGDKLTTCQIRNAVVRHPVTRESLWFNQAHLFHASNLPKDIHDSMLHVMKNNLPRDVLYGDGSAIDINDLEHIRDVFNQVKQTFPWRKNDVLLLDNMMISHGRNPYDGHRKILVAMAEPHSLSARD